MVLRPKEDLGELARAHELAAKSIPVFWSGPGNKRDSARTR